jgi:hypothetical protein
MSATFEKVARVARDFHITPYGSKPFLREVARRHTGKGIVSIRRNVETRATRATTEPMSAQHWLDEILDGVIEESETTQPPDAAHKGCKAFRVCLPGRPEFGVICPQGEDAVRAQWINADVEPHE